MIWDKSCSFSGLPHGHPVDWTRGSHRKGPDLGASFHGWRFVLRLLRALLPALAAVAGLAAAQSEGFPASPVRDIPAVYWIDGTGGATLEMARAAFEKGGGRRADPQQVMPFDGVLAIWYQLQLPAVARPVDAVFTVPFPGMNQVDLFRPDGAGGWQVQHSGDAVPVDDWPLRYLHAAFAFTLQPGEAQPTYLRVEHSHPTRVPWELRDAEAFSQSSKGWHLGLGAYIGFMVLVILLSVANAVSWQDRIHLFYAFHVVMVGLSILAHTGLAGEYLWPSNPWWTDKAAVVIPALSGAWMALFVREVVAERGERLVSWSLLALTAYSALGALGFLLLGREHFYRAPTVYAVPVLAILLAVLGWYSLRRPKVGLWILSGFAMLAVGTLFPLMRNLGLLPASFLTVYGPQIGGALEIPLVLIGLYFRSRERRDNRVRVEALTHADPLTGVGNHRVLVERLELLLRRARRDPSMGAVLRVHVGNLNTIRDDYGREAAEAALVRAAECVTLEAKEGDMVAREQGGDLVLVLEGKVSRAQTVEAGRNIIARGLKYSRRLPPNVTLSLKVAGLCAPLPGNSASTLLGTLGHVTVEISNDRQGKALRVIGAGSPAPSDLGAGTAPRAGS